ncbi:MAG: hypothetical protein EA365_06095, partial [Gloeocapsa sp. DLM2.Bin57]
MSKRIRKPTTSTNQSTNKSTIVLNPAVNKLLEEMATKAGLSKIVVLEKLVQDSVNQVTAETDTTPTADSGISQEIYDNLKQQTTEQVNLIAQLKESLQSKDAAIKSLNFKLESQSQIVSELQQQNKTHQEANQQLQAKLDSQTKQTKELQQQNKTHQEAN